MIERIIRPAGITGLLGLTGMLAGCQAPPQPPMNVAISFVARLGGHPFSCSSRVVLPDGQVLEPSHLKMFVHDLRLVDERGKEEPLALEQDGRWQYQNLAQLDFEDGTGACRNGSTATHTVVTGHLPRGTWRGLRFRMGVPFELNHVNPALAPAPLNDTSMHWSWQGGFKFLRFDARVNTKGYLIHLGSTGCEGTIGHISGCARPNRPEARIDAFSLEHPSVTFDLDRLLVGAVARADDDRPGGCMATAEAPDCAPVFRRLGLDLKSGQAVTSAEVFTSP